MMNPYPWIIQAYQENNEYCGRVLFLQVLRPSLKITSWVSMVVVSVCLGVNRSLCLGKLSRLYIFPAVAVQSNERIANSLSPARSVTIIAVWGIVGLFLSLSPSGRLLLHQLDSAKLQSLEASIDVWSWSCCWPKSSAVTWHDLRSSSQISLYLSFGWPLNHTKMIM